MMSNPFKILFPLLELLYHFYWTIIDYDVIKVGKNRAFGLERRPFMIKFVGWLVRDPEILSLDVKAFLFMDDTIRNERNILHQLQSVIASERRKKSCREQFTMSAERQAQYIPQLLPICTHSIFDNRAQKSSSKSKWKITLQSDCRIMRLVTTVKPIVLKWGKQLSDRSNQKMQSQLHFQALSSNGSDIDSHAQLIPHLRIPEWAIQRHLNSLLLPKRSLTKMMTT